MKIFLSWSGDLSHKVALILRDWIPSVIQSVEPYVSSEDIDKGARWSTDIAKELESSSYGILCVTSDNLNSPWLNFEAGALSKSFDKANVSPFLFDLKRSEVKGPSLQFQSTIFSKDDVKKLVTGINKVDDDSSLDEPRLEKVFEVWWPTLEEELNNLLEEKQNGSSIPVAKVSQNIDAKSEILEEVVDLLRTQHKILKSPEELLPPEYIEHILRKSSRHNNRVGPAAINELEHSFQRLKRFAHSAESDDPFVEEVQMLIKKLDRPINHIIRRISGKKESEFIDWTFLKAE